VPAKQDRRGRNPSLLRDLDDRLGREERAPRAPQRTVRGDVDALLLAEVDNLLLRQGRVVLDLVDGGHDGDVGQQLLEVPLAVVGDANGLDFTRGKELLHTLPGRDVRVGMVDVAGAVGKFGEEGVVSCCRNRHQILYTSWFR